MPPLAPPPPPPPLDPPLHGAVHFGIDVWVDTVSRTTWWCALGIFTLSVHCCNDENVCYLEVAWLHCRCCESYCCLVCPIHIVCFQHPSPQISSCTSGLTVVMRQVVFVASCMTCTYAYVVPHYISFNSHQVLPLITATSPLACVASLCYIAVHFSRGAATLTMPCFVMVLATVIMPRYCHAVLPLFAAILTIPCFVVMLAAIMWLCLCHTMFHLLCFTATVMVPCLYNAALPLSGGSDSVTPHCICHAAQPLSRRFAYIVLLDHCHVAWYLFACCICDAVLPLA